jgi:hypothetical protein
LLKSVGQNNISIVEPAILFVEMIVLVLVVILFAVFRGLSSFVGAILLKILVLGCIGEGGGGRGLLGVPVFTAGVSRLRNGKVHIDVLGLFEVITLIVIHCLLINILLLVI